MEQYNSDGLNNIHPHLNISRNFSLIASERQQIQSLITEDSPSLCQLNGKITQRTLKHTKILFNFFFKQGC